MLRSHFLLPLCLAPLLTAAPAAAQIASYANTPNQLAIGQRLDAPVADPLPALVTARADLAAATPAQRTAALNAFGAGSYQIIPELTSRVNEFQERGIRRYLRDYRRGGTGVDGPVDAATPSSRVFGAWANAAMEDGELAGNVDRQIASFGTQGGMGGLDLRFANQQLIGIYGGFQNLDVSLTANTRNSRAESWFAGGYGTFGVGPIYVDLFGSYGETDYDIFRSVQFGQPTATGLSSSQTYRGDSGARTWLAGGTLGFTFNFAGFEFEPFGGVRYTDLKVRRFNEGTDFGALSVGRQSYESVLTNIGLRVGGAFEVRGATVRPELRGAWRREWLNPNNRRFTYSLAGTGNSDVASFSPTPLGRDYATFGAGFTVSGPGSPLSFVIDYNGETWGNRDIHGISGGVRLTF